jgi:F-type H+-transporting ATPase subunit b
MLIDWFTVVAQALNFLVLVWLMKRFLYKPILHAIDEREKLVAAELADAAAKEAEAKKERDLFQRKNEEFDQKRGALLSQATEQARAERERLFDQARKAAEAFSAKRQEALLNEEHSLKEDISRRTREEVFGIARKVLADLAGASLEERMVEVFVRRLHALGPEEIGRLAKALEAKNGPLTVRTTSELTPTQCAEAEGAIKEMLGQENQVRFETAPGLISGIELSADGEKVGWSVAEYLTSMEQGVAELVKDKGGSAARAEPVAQEPEPEPVSH